MPKGNIPLLWRLRFEMRTRSYPVSLPLRCMKRNALDSPHLIEALFSHCMISHQQRKGTHCSCSPLLSPLTSSPQDIFMHGMKPNKRWEGKIRATFFLSRFIYLVFSSCPFAQETKQLGADQVRSDKARHARHGQERKSLRCPGEIRIVWIGYNVSWTRRFGVKG